MDDGKRVTTESVEQIESDTEQNKSLSEDQNNLLSLQGIGWVTRKAIKMATITVSRWSFRVDVYAN